jgi:pSer/pThr/pTyr-binding forkhead associated (FHA) protein
VGRGPDNDVVINNPAVSSNHCKITLEGETYYVEDMDSTNGTYVNEKRIKKCGLHNQDVVGVAKHSLVFMENSVSAEEDKTVFLSPQKQSEILSQSAKTPSKLGRLRVLKGLAGAPEYELKGLSTYIGKSERVQIPIKGTGLFGSAPEVVASIHRKSDGYSLIAVVPGYPILNGEKVFPPVLLKNGDILVCGGTTFLFNLEDSSS